MIKTSLSEILVSILNSCANKRLKHVDNRSDMCP